MTPPDSVLSSSPEAPCDPQCHRRAQPVPRSVAPGRTLALKFRFLSKVLGPVALVAAPLILTGCLEGSLPAADLILINGIVHPMDGTGQPAEAVAVHLGRIQMVADNDMVLKLNGPGTRTVDLQGATVIPGLIDAHAHVAALGEMILNRATGNSLYLDLSDSESQEEVVQRIRARARELPSGQWILGKGWNHERWVTGELPTKRLLSEIVRYNPVFLVHADGETVWVNQKALDAGRIGAGTPDPPGGRILRKPRSSEPDGILVGRAWQPILRRIPPLAVEERARAILAGLDWLAASGRTMVQTVGATGRLGLDDLGDPDDGTVALFRRLAVNERLPIRVGVIVPGPSAAAELLLQTGPAIGLGGDHLDVRTIKLVADGALATRNAALLEPYADDPTTAGSQILTHEEIADWAGRGVESGVQIAVHAVGDAAVRAATIGFAQALSTRPGLDARFRIEHLSLFTPPDLARLGRIGAIAVVRPGALSFLADGRVDEQRVGPTRSERMYAFDSIRHAGVRLAGASGNPDRLAHPLIGIYLAVTRQTPDGLPEGGWYPRQRLKHLDALRLYTIGAAYAAMREREAGSLEPGKWADLTVLSRDILEIPAAEILQTEVLATYVGGREVYRKNPPPAP